MLSLCYPNSQSAILVWKNLEAGQSMWNTGNNVWKKSCCDPNHHVVSLLSSKGMSAIFFSPPYFLQNILIIHFYLQTQLLTIFLLKCGLFPEIWKALFFQLSLYTLTFKECFRNILDRFLKRIGMQCLQSAYGATAQIKHREFHSSGLKY